MRINTVTLTGFLLETPAIWPGRAGEWFTRLSVALGHRYSTTAVRVEVRGPHAESLAATARTGHLVFVTGELARDIETDALIVHASEAFHIERIAPLVRTDLPPPFPAELVDAEFPDDGLEDPSPAPSRHDEVRIRTGKRRSLRLFRGRKDGEP